MTVSLDGLVQLQRPTYATDQSRRRTTRSVALTIDGAPVSVPEGTTILGACRAAGIEIPTLCFLDTLHPVNACRVCVVEVEGARVLVPSCSRAVEEGMVVRTRSDRVKHSRKLVLELLASSVDLSTTPDVERVDRRIRRQAGALRPAGAARAGRNARRVGRRTSRAAGSGVRRDRRRADEGRQRSLRPRLRQVHSLLQVRRGVRAGSSEHFRHRRRRPRVRRAHLHRVRRAAPRVGVRVLRQLHRRVPHRRADGEDRVRQARRGHVGRVADDANGHDLPVLRRRAVRSRLHVDDGEISRRRRRSRTRSRRAISASRAASAGGSSQNRDERNGVEWE